MCVAAHYHDGTRLPFCEPILVALSELCTVQDQIDGFATLQQLIMDKFLPIPHTLDNSLFFVNPSIEIVCGGSSAFDHERLRLIFSYFTIFIIVCNDSLQKWSHFVAFHRASFGSLLFSNDSNCYAVDILCFRYFLTAYVVVLLDQLQNFFDFSSDWSTRARCIFDIQIFGTTPESFVH